MNDNENNKSMEALPDEALDQVTGGNFNIWEYNRFLRTVCYTCSRFPCGKKGDDVWMLTIFEELGNKATDCPYKA